MLTAVFVKLFMQGVHTWVVTSDGCHNYDSMKKQKQSLNLIYNAYKICHLYKSNTREQLEEDMPKIFSY